MIISISCIITFMYFASGIRKIENFDKEISVFSKKTSYGPFISKTAIICAIIIEVVCPLIITESLHITSCKKNENSNVNWKFVGSCMCSLLILFTILATLIYHFPPKGSQYYPFVSNLTSIGALCLLFYTLRSS